MGSADFHSEKIREVLSSYKSSDTFFVRGVCLFYLAAHAVDYVLALRNIHPSTHRGRRKHITEHFDEFTYSKFDQLLSDSLRVRYTEIPTEGLIIAMTRNLVELVEHLSKEYQLQRDQAAEIIKNL